MANSTLRAVSTLLMLMALLLPVAPAGAQALKDEGADVHAANVPGGGPLPPGVTVLPFVSEPADCTVSQDGTARYFLTVQSTAGTDILNATGRLIFPGLLPFIPGQVVNMTNGDLEAQASDGQFASGCTRAYRTGMPTIWAARSSRRVAQRATGV